MGNVSVVGIELTGIRSTYGDLFLSKYGDELSLAGKYKNEIKKPTKANVVQVIGDVSEKMVVYFMPEATYDLTTKYKIDRPLILGCNGEIISGPWRDSITDSYPIGIFDDTFKPTAEYPVAGVDNVVLDLAYTWGVKNVIYPLPLATELSIDNIKIEMVSGFHRFEGKYYKDAASNNTIRLKYRLRNIGNKTIKTKHWGTPLTVMFDDGSHVSQMDVNVSVFCSF
ncbi:unnamed protein product [marine sediment metagenome]|uniref:Uncharacterized protein n=1 Tax=marine sediment metagenome TaxID=412755 RepID=X1I332_9ZZZZ